MGYRQSVTAKIIRTIHIVSFVDGRESIGGQSAKTIKEYLRNVPDSATLVEVEYEGNQVTLKFEEEEEIGSQATTPEIG